MLYVRKATEIIKSKIIIPQHSQGHHYPTSPCATPTRLLNPFRDWDSVAVGGSRRFLGYLKHSNHPITCAQQSRGNVWGDRDFPLGLSLLPCPNVLLFLVSENHPSTCQLSPHPCFPEDFLSQWIPWLRGSSTGLPSPALPAPLGSVWQVLCFTVEIG